MRTSIFWFALIGASSAVCVAAEAPARFALKPIPGGGFAIEREAPAGETVAAHGIAAITDLVPLLKEDAAAPENIDFAAGKKIDGVFTILVGRDDGTLGKYEGASDVVLFAAPTSLTTVGDVTTLKGAIVFALKIDNSGAASLQRFETGAITLTRHRKSL